MLDRAAVYELTSSGVTTSPAAGGPWDRSLQHGSGPAALVARAAERIESESPMMVTRLTIDLLRPVPIAALELKTEIARQGRKIPSGSIRLLANGVDVVRATFLKVRRDDSAPFVSNQCQQLDLPAVEDCPPLSDPSSPSPFLSGVSMRMVDGDPRRPGPAAIWFRLDRPFVAGEPATPLMRAAATADFCNGLSTVLDPAEWTFINADLSIHLARPPVGEWILLDAQTWLGSGGSAVALGRLADATGYFARAAQSLVIERRIPQATDR